MFRGRQSTRNPISRPHRRDFVGANPSPSPRSRPRSPGACGRQPARNHDFGPHPRGFVGAHRCENPIRDTMRGGLWVPTGTKLRSPAPPEGFCGRQDARKSVSRGHWERGYQRTRNLDSSRHARGFVGANPADRPVLAPRMGLCGCRMPHRAPARLVAGSVELLVNGRSILHISAQSICLARDALRNGRAPPRRRHAGRPALDTAGPLAPPGGSGRA